MQRISDTELLFLIIYYQQHPADPRATAALLAPLEGLIRTISSKRAEPLGGKEDARQETIAAVLQVAQDYDPKNNREVALTLLRDAADCMINAVRYGIRSSEKELHDQWDDPITQETEPEDVKTILDRAERHGVLRSIDRPLLILWAGGLSYQEIANYINEQESREVTSKAAEMRVQRALTAIREWAQYNF